jgi:hypothetical protein
MARGGRGGGGGGSGSARGGASIDLTRSPYNFRAAATQEAFEAAPLDYDVTPHLKAALARMEARAAVSQNWRGGEILFPTGYMALTQPITPPYGNVKFVGQGKYSTYVYAQFCSGVAFDLENEPEYEWGPSIVTGEDHSIQFNGAGDDDHYINLTLESAQFWFRDKPQCCIEFFIILDSFDGGDTYRIMSCGGSLNTALGAHADSLTVHVPAGATPTVQLLLRLSDGSVTGCTTGNLTVGQLHHVALQWNTSGGAITCTAYLDGVQGTQNTAGVGLTVKQRWDETMTIGPGTATPMYSTYVMPADFRMSSVRILFNEVRTAPFTAPTTALTFPPGYQGMLISMTTADEDDLDSYGVLESDPSYVRVKVSTGVFGYVRMRRANSGVNYVSNVRVKGMTVSTNGGGGDESSINGNGGTCIYGYGAGQSTFENLRVDGHNGLLLGYQGYGTVIHDLEIRSSRWGLLTFNVTGLMSVDTVFAYEGKFPVCLIGSGSLSNIFVDPGRAVVPVTLIQEINHEAPFSVDSLVIGTESEVYASSEREYELFIAGRGEFIFNGALIRQDNARSTCILAGHNIGGAIFNGLRYITGHSEPDDVKLITFVGAEGVQAARPADGAVVVELNQFTHHELAGSINLVTSNDPGHCRYSDHDAHPGIYQGEATIADAAVSSTVTFESTIDGVAVAAPLANATYKVRMMTTARSGANAVSSQVAHASARATTGFLMAVRQAPGAGTSVTIGWEVVGYEGVE